MKASFRKDLKILFLPFILALASCEQAGIATSTSSLAEDVDASELSNTDSAEEASVEITSLDSSMVESALESLENDALQTGLSTTSLRLFPNRRHAVDGDCVEKSEVELDDGGLQVTSIYDECRLRRRARPARNATVSGSSIQTTYLFEADDGGENYDREGSLSRDLEISGQYRGSLNILSSFSWSMAGSLADSIVKEVSGTSSRQREDALGQVIRDFQVEVDREFRFEFEESDLQQVVLNGNSTITQNLAQRMVEIANNNVTWTDECCHPISGSRSITVTPFESDDSTEHILRYNGVCGQADLDGQSIELNECEAP